MNELLQFEKEKCRDLRRFPMYFRMKLDVCGIKLSKQDWNSFALPEKMQLLAMPCTTPQQVAAFRKKLIAMIGACDGDFIEVSPGSIMGSNSYPWTDKKNIPPVVRQQIHALGDDAANPEKWAMLSDLQRFALIKLTQPGHLKQELRLALQEFALLPPESDATL
jgi:hypothetical protein